MQRIFLVGMMVCSSLRALTQDSSYNSLSITGYVEFYYLYDLHEPASKDRPGFLYNHKRHNEFNVNLAYLKAAYSDKKVRANIALMAGTYPQYNLVAEPQLMQHVFEANAGYAFSSRWSMDAGILPSHIGLESAVSKDCWNLSRSILAENTPYFETGVKLNYTPNIKWSASFLVLNGWQNIRENNSGKAIGTQVQFRPNEKWLLNSSSFIGNEKPDSVAKQVRLFHNFCATYAVSQKLNAALLFDIGTENSNSWYGAALLLQYNTTEKFRLAFRAEQYKDKRGVIIATMLPGGFNVTGLAFNTDFIPVRNIAIRAEARYLHAQNNLFEKAGVPKNDNFSLLGSVAVSF